MSATEGLLRTPEGGWRIWPGLLLLILVTAAGTQASAVLGRYEIDVLTTLLCLIGLAQAWNLLAGFSGQVSLGTSAFVGTGAYTLGLLELHAGFSYPEAMVGALLAGGLLSLLLAPPLLRLRGDYFSIGTLAAALALQAWIYNWSFAGGSTGLNLPVEGVPSPVAVFQLACVVAASTTGAAFLVAHSSFGARLRAVRDNEAAATGLGVSAFRHRLGALVLSGALSGLVGGLIALQQLSFEPTGMLGIGWTINALLMTIVGGIGTVLGPVVGAVLVYYVLTKRLEGYQTLSVVIEGIVLVVIVRFAPRGIWPLFLSLLTRAYARSSRACKTSFGGPHSS